MLWLPAGGATLLQRGHSCLPIYTCVPPVCHLVIRAVAAGHSLSRICTCVCQPGTQHPAPVRTSSSLCPSASAAFVASCACLIAVSYSEGKACTQQVKWHAVGWGRT